MPKDFNIFRGILSSSIIGFEYDTMSFMTYVTAWLFSCRSILRTVLSDTYSSKDRWSSSLTALSFNKVINCARYLALQMPLAYQKPYTPGKVSYPSIPLCPRFAASLFIQISACIRFNSRPSPHIRSCQHFRSRSAWLLRRTRPPKQRVTRRGDPPPNLHW